MEKQINSVIMQNQTMLMLFNKRVQFGDACYVIVYRNKYSSLNYTL